ncbi:unnamed protein product, partial [marine sediment metagenome]
SDNYIAVSYWEEHIYLYEGPPPIDTTVPTYSNVQVNTTTPGVAALFSILYDDDTILETEYNRPL